MLACWDSRLRRKFSFRFRRRGLGTRGHRKSGESMCLGQMRICDSLKGCNSLPKLLLFAHSPVKGPWSGFGRRASDNKRLKLSADNQGNAALVNTSKEFWEARNNRPAKTGAYVSAQRWMPNGCGSVTAWRDTQIVGVEQLVACWAHNPEVAGSSPAPGTFSRTRIGGRMKRRLARRLGISRAGSTPESAKSGRVQ